MKMNMDQWTRELFDRDKLIGTVFMGNRLKEANEKFERGEFEVEAPEVQELEFKIYKRGYDLDFECSGDMPANLYDILRQTVENWYEENGHLCKNM